MTCSLPAVNTTGTPTLQDRVLAPVSRSELATVLLLSGFMALLYHQGAGWPVINYFPLLERLRDPGFLPHDFYTNSFGEFSARHYIAELWHGIATFLDVHYRYVVAWANLVRMFFAGIFAWYFFRAFSHERDAALIALFLGGISFFVLPLFVGYNFIGNSNTAHSISLVLNILAWGLAVRGRIALAFGVLAVAALLHPVNGLQGAGAAVMIILLSSTWIDLLRLAARPSVWLAGAMFCAALLANYLPYQWAQPEAPLSAAEFIRIVGHVRHAHHLIPSAFPPLAWLIFSGFVLCYFYLLRAAQLRDWQRRIMVGMSIYLGFMMLIGYVFVEVVPVRMVASIWPYRALLIFPMLFLTLLGQFVLDQARAGRWWLVALFLLPFLPVRPYLSTMTWMLHDDLILYRVGLFALAMLLAVWAGRRSVAASTVSGLRAPLPVCLLVMVVPLFLWSVSRWEPWRLLDLGPREQVYFKLRAYTEPDAVILSEIRAASNQLIRLYSRRAVAASIDFPFLDRYYDEWEWRFRTAYGSYEGQPHYVDARTDAELNCMADVLQATHVVRSVPVPDPWHLLLVYEGPGEGRRGVDFYLYHNEIESRPADTVCIQPVAMQPGAQ